MPMQAEHAKMPITDVQLVAIAFMAVLALQNITTDDWEALTNAQKTWTKWKYSFHVAHLAGCCLPWFCPVLLLFLLPLANRQ